MQIQSDAIVTLEYTLTNTAGEVLDTSKGRGPFAYLHGRGQIVRGLEEELEGRSAGEEFSVQVPAAKGYGEYDEKRTFRAARRDMGLAVEPEVGMRLVAETEQGRFPVVVKEVADEMVTLDANHPLAGEDLHFEIAVVEVRAATPEELQHGHAHGPGGAH